MKKSFIIRNRDMKKSFIIQRRDTMSLKLSAYAAIVVLKLQGQKMHILKIIF